MGARSFFARRSSRTAGVCEVVCATMPLGPHGRGKRPLSPLSFADTSLTGARGARGGPPRRPQRVSHPYSSTKRSRFAWVRVRVRVSSKVVLTGARAAQGWNKTRQGASGGGGGAEGAPQHHPLPAHIHQFPTTRSSRLGAVPQPTHAGVCPQARGLPGGSRCRTAGECGGAASEPCTAVVVSAREGDARADGTAVVPAARAALPARLHGVRRWLRHRLPLAAAAAVLHRHVPAELRPVRLCVLPLRAWLGLGVGLGLRLG